jgi:hypothetical protein
MRADWGLLLALGGRDVGAVVLPRGALRVVVLSDLNGGGGGAGHEQGEGGDPKTDHVLVGVGWRQWQSWPCARAAPPRRRCRAQAPEITDSDTW